MVCNHLNITFDISKFHEVKKLITKDESFKRITDDLKVMKFMSDFNYEEKRQEFKIKYTDYILNLCKSVLGEYYKFWEEI